MGEPRASWIRRAAILVAVGILVGGAVAALSVSTTAPLCAPGGVGADCRDLVATLGRRTGILAGVTTLVMTLLAAGLLRMVAQDDRDRAERAMEAYRLARERGIGEK